MLSTLHVLPRQSLFPICQSPCFYHRNDNEEPSRPAIHWKWQDSDIVVIHAQIIVLFYPQGRTVPGCLASLGNITPVVMPFVKNQVTWESSQLEEPDTDFWAFSEGSVAERMRTGIS
jgi:hypothetical protein